MVAQQKREYLMLNALRGIAAVLVMLHHLAVDSPYDDVLLNSSWMAVDFFFCLSGFVIAHAYRDRIRRGLTFSEFIGLRLIRLYPMYALGLTLGVAAFLLYPRLTSMSGWEEARSVIESALFLPHLNTAISSDVYHQAIGDTFPVDPPAWSLFFELVANGLFFFVPTRHLKSALAMIVAALVAMVALRLEANIRIGAGSVTEGMVGGFPRVIAGFYIGVLIYTAHERGLLDARPVRILVSGAVLMLAALALAYSSHALNMTAVYGLVLLFAVPLAMKAGLAFELRSRLAREIAEFLGAISYPLYVLHFPMMRLVDNAFDVKALAPQEFAAYCAGFTIVALIVSYGLARLIDEPARRALKRVLYAVQRRPLRDAVPEVQG